MYREFEPSSLHIWELTNFYRKQEGRLADSLLAATCAAALIRFTPSPCQQRLHTARRARRGAAPGDASCVRVRARGRAAG